MSSKNTTDLTQGSVFKRLLLFTLPLLATNLLQQLYNAADVAVVGRFAGETSLAAVGATSGITTLLLNIFIGLATGANVVCANLYGARKRNPFPGVCTPPRSFLLSAPSAVCVASVSPQVLQF